jgi:hypothetical protein
VVAATVARARAAAPAARRAARLQLGVAAGQLAAGLGNLAFVVAAARLLEPAPFADIAAFTALYLLVHLPVAAATAAGVIDHRAAGRRTAAIAGAGAGAGIALLVAAGPVAGGLGLPTGLVTLLALALPGAVPLGLARGRLYAAGDHAGVVAGLLAEPAARLVAGIPAMAVLGPAGGAAAVVAGGYAALAVTTRRSVTPAPAPVGDGTTTRAARRTAAAFVALAFLQNQDLLVAGAVLDGTSAGRFAVLSAIGGAVAFATATVPFVLLPARHDGRAPLAVAVAGAAVVGLGATLAGVVAPRTLADLVAGDGDAPASHLVAPYLAAMGCFGVARVAVAHLTAKGRTWPAVVTAGIAAAHLAALLVVGDSVRAIVATTATATGGLGLVLAAPAALRRPFAARARAALRQPAVVAVAVATAVGLVARLAVTRGLWVDEAISVAQARLGLGELLVDVRNTDVHPPLHHLLLWGTVRTLGAGELAVRLPSLVAGTLLVPALYDAGRTLYDRRTGVVAACLAAVAPFAVWYSQEARMYALFMLLATVATTALARVLADPTPRRWILWAAASACVLWTQWFGVLVVGVHVAAAAVVAARDRERRRRLTVGLLAASAAVAVACLPLVDLLGDQLAAFAERRAVSVAPTTAGAVAGDPAAELSIYAMLANGIWAVWGYHADDVMAQITALWPLLMLVALALLGRGRSRSTTLLVAVAAVPALALLAAGVVKRDLFELRYFCAAVPAALLLGARGITTVARRPASLFVLAALATSTLAVGLVDQQLNGANPRRYDFDGALDQVQRRATGDDVLLYEPAYLGDVIDYYAPDLDARPLGEFRAQARERGDIFVLSTRRVADSRGTAARVGHVLAQLEEGGRRVTAEIARPNVDVWELS